MAQVGAQDRHGADEEDHEHRGPEESSEVAIQRPDETGAAVGAGGILGREQGVKKDGEQGGAEEEGYKWFNISEVAGAV
jgi:hypothetical protein